MLRIRTFIFKATEATSKQDAAQGVTVVEAGEGDQSADDSENSKAYLEYEFVRC